MASSDVNKVTLELIVKREADALKRRHTFLEFAEKMGGVEVQTGGRSINTPVMIRDHSQVTFHSDGFEATNDAVSPILESSSLLWSYVTAPVALNDKEARENNGDLAKLKVYEKRIQSVMGSMGRTINSQILADTSGISTSGLLSLYGETGGVTTGILEGKVKASQVNSVGGLAKTASAPGWCNAFATASGAFATNGLQAMYSLRNQIASVHVGPSPINLIIASEASHALYWKQLQPGERYVKADDALDAGRHRLAFDSAPIAIDLALTQSTWSGDDIASMYFLNFDALKLYFLEGAQFSIEPKGYASSSIVQEWTVSAGLQLCPSHLGSLGFLANANA